MMRSRNAKWKCRFRGSPGAVGRPAWIPHTNGRPGRGHRLRHRAGQIDALLQVALDRQRALKLKEHTRVRALEAVGRREQPARRVVAPVRQVAPVVLLEVIAPTRSSPRAAHISAWPGRTARPAGDGVGFGNGRPGDVGAGVPGLTITDDEGAPEKRPGVRTRRTVFGTWTAPPSTAETVQIGTPKTCPGTRADREKSGPSGPTGQLRGSKGCSGHGTTRSEGPPIRKRASFFGQGRDRIRGVGTHWVPVPGPRLFNSSCLFSTTSDR